MRYMDLVEARRITPDVFYELSIAKYGVEASQSLTRDQIKDLAAANKVAVPGYVNGQKTSRGKYSTRPPGYIDKEPEAKPKSEFTPEKVREVANHYREYMKMTRMAKSVWQEDGVHETSNKDTISFEFALRSYGSWVQDPDDYDEDSDFLRPSQETHEALGRILAEMGRIYPKMDFQYRYSEKEWLYFSVQPK